MHKQDIQESSLLSKRIRLYKILAIFFACIAISICLVASIRWIRENAQELGFIDADEKGPHYKQVKKIMTPLRYSGLKDLLDPDTRLSLDFENNNWTLHNVHHFDKKGKLLLKEGRYGLCGDLAAYMYEQLSPYLDKTYSIKFVRVAESGFFPLPQGSHYVLKITDRSLHVFPREFILDPSFHKYRRMEYFDNYCFLNEKSALKFYEEKNKDQTFAINVQCPILIKRDFIIQMAVTSVDEKFDKKNFAVDLTITKRYAYVSKSIFSIRMKNGIRGTYKNEGLAINVMTRNEFEKLVHRISYFFENL